MPTLKELKQRIAAIEDRNKKVEKDKAWEVSWTRKVVIALPWLNAIIPSIAFLLSTLTLPFIKKTWEKYH